MSENAFPDKKYKVIYADPPWKISKFSRVVRPQQKGEATPYDVMSFEEIKHLPVKNLIHEDGCMLFLWTTHKWLPKSFEVMKEWGFDYHCMLTWDKGVGFCPFSFMWSTEFCLFGQVKGKWNNLKKIGEKTLIRESPSKHSKKPQRMYSLIEKVSDTPRIELFARTRIHGWDTWGNDEKLNLQPLEKFT